MTGRFSSGPAYLAQGKRASEAERGWTEELDRLLVRSATELRVEDDWVDEGTTARWVLLREKVGEEFTVAEVAVRLAHLRPTRRASGVFYNLAAA